MIVDLHMPVMDGPTLLRELRDRGQRVPCVVATAERRPRDLLTGLNVGAVLAKPFDINQLLAQVAETCGLAEGS